MTSKEAKVYFIDSNERIISVAKDENRYNYETQQIEDVFMRIAFEANKLAIKALEQEPKFIAKSDGTFERIKSEWEYDHEILKAYSDGANEVLDKIRTEIEQISSRYSISRERGGMGQVEWSDRLIKESEVLQIIDKYKSESEG